MRRHLARDAAAVAVSSLGIGAQACEDIPRRGGAGVLKPGTIGADITRGGDDHARRYAHPPGRWLLTQVFFLYEV
jgi:hypothetical protein